MIRRQTELLFHEDWNIAIGRTQDPIETMEQIQCSRYGTLFARAYFLERPVLATLVSRQAIVLQQGVNWAVDYAKHVETKLANERCWGFDARAREAAPDFGPLVSVGHNND